MRAAALVIATLVVVVLTLIIPAPCKRWYAKGCKQGGRQNQLFHFSLSLTNLLRLKASHGTSRAMGKSSNRGYLGTSKEDFRDQ